MPRSVRYLLALLLIAVPLSAQDVDVDALLANARAIAADGPSDAAIAAYEEARAAAEAHAPRREPVAMNELAQVHQRRGEVERAIILYRQAAARLEQLDGPDHPNLAAALYNLAQASLERGRQNEAEAFYQQALVIWLDAHGPRHRYVLRALDDLAALYASNERWSAAQDLLLRLLALREDLAQGSDELNVVLDHAATLSHLALLHVRSGRTEHAEKLYDRALTLYAERAPEHPDVAVTLNNLASLYLATERETAAEPLLRRALVLAEADAPQGDTASSIRENLRRIEGPDGEGSESFEPAAVAPPSTSSGATLDPEPETAPSQAAPPAPPPPRLVVTQKPGTSPAPPTSSGFWAQVASRQSRDDAQLVIDELVARHADTLGRTSHRFQRADLGDRGVWFRVHLGPLADRDAAQSLCSALAAEGWSDCFPVKD